MMKKFKLGKNAPGRPSKLVALIVVGIVMLVGLYLLLRSFAATGTLYLSPASGSQSSTFTTQVRLNTGGEPVNVVRATISFPTDKLELVSVTSTGSAFSNTTPSDGIIGNGTVTISRGQPVPVSGDVLVATLNFRVITGATGSAQVAYVSGDAFSSNTNTNIVTSRQPANYTLPQPVTDTPPAITSFTVSPSSVVQGATVTLAANASDDRQVSKVEFSRAGQLLSTDTDSPYSATFSTSGLAPGNYQVSAKAYDSANQTAVANATLVVTAQPVTTPGRFYLTPPSGPQSGSFSVQVKLNTAGEQVNSLEAKISYPADKLDFLGSSDSGSPFSSPFPGNGTASNGVITVSKGDPTPHSGDVLIATLTFKVHTGATGSAALAYTFGEALRANSGTNVVGTRDGANYDLVSSPGGDGQAPTKPGKPVASLVTSNSIRITWGASTDNVGVARYVVYRNGQSVSSNTTGTTYTDNNLSASTTYNYTVQAYDSQSNASAVSDSTSITTSAATGGPVVTVPPSSGGGSSGGGVVVVTPNKNVPNTAKTQLKVDNKVVGTSNQAPFSIPLDTSTLSDGSHEVTVESLDANNNVLDSSKTTIQVHNKKPTLWQRIRSKWWWLLILLLLGAGGIGWFIYKKRRNGGDTPASIYGDEDINATPTNVESIWPQPPVGQVIVPGEEPIISTDPTADPSSGEQSVPMPVSQTPETPPLAPTTSVISPDGTPAEPTPVLPPAETIDPRAPEMYYPEDRSTSPQDSNTSLGDGNQKAGS